MNPELSSLTVIVGPEETIDLVIQRMANEEVVHAGLAVVVDPDNRVLGVVTDGDFRRAYARGVSGRDPISSIMIKEPIALPVQTNPDEIIFELSQRVERAPHLTAKTIRHILMVDEEFRLVDVHDFTELLWDRDERSARVQVIGLGFVGLTVALALTNSGHRVTGVDKNAELIEQLKCGKPRIYEKGLEANLTHGLNRGVLTFSTELEEYASSIFIIAVGSPLSVSGEVDSSDLRNAASQLSKVIKPGALVLLRSTVPVGFTRDVLLPILENGSGLRLAEDFNLAFSPERTVAGDALKELRGLPQLVGGMTPRCLERAARFWAGMTHTVVQLASPEAVEIAKLANNSFRNLSFAFANELTTIATAYNLEVNEIIHAANNGYPRNPIPSASPGVGGYCLPKDSILLATSFKRSADLTLLSRVACAVNERACQDVVTVVERFCERTKPSITTINVLIVGIAFKGEPETNDLRGSTGIKVARELSKRGAKVFVWDAVVMPEEMAGEGLEPAIGVTLDESTQQCEVILIMNNHRENANFDIAKTVCTSLPRLIFDGWELLDRKEVESVRDVYFASPGYLTSF